MSEILLDVLHYILVGFGSMWLLWVFYLAVMNLDRAKRENKLNLFTYILGVPVLLIGALVDTIVNVFIMTIIFFELPREALVTSRLQRHWKTAPDSWRGKLSKNISRSLLDNFDPTGDHID
jgi:hypothetical protein